MVRPRTSTTKSLPKGKQYLQRLPVPKFSGPLLPGKPIRNLPKKSSMSRNALPENLQLANNSVRKEPDKMINLGKSSELQGGQGLVL